MRSPDRLSSASASVMSSWLNPSDPVLPDPIFVSSWSEVSLAGSRECASPVTLMVFAVT
jgi:hypothetical protein